ncbi:hypothetical protein HYV44_03795 [Candidatus Microgenomates bacterium]|nr:hypothetical protein [Candidatus Microgenomates bacterium]
MIYFLRKTIIATLAIVVFTIGFWIVAKNGNFAVFASPFSVTGAYPAPNASGEMTIDTAKKYFFYMQIARTTTENAQDFSVSWYDVPDSAIPVGGGLAGVDYTLLTPLYTVSAKPIDVGGKYGYQTAPYTFTPGKHNIAVRITNLSIGEFQIYSFNGKILTVTGVGGTPPEPITYTYVDNYNYPDGILVYTSVLGPDKSTATLTQGQEAVYYLTVVNQSSVNKKVDLRYYLPLGFTYVGMVDNNDPAPKQENNSLVWYALDVGAPERVLQVKVRT